MKIREYPKSTSLTDTDSFIIETANGTKYINKSDLEAALKVAASSDGLDEAVTHRNTYRGKNLGTSFTTAQKTAIKNGTFDDLYVGDYWVMGNNNWRIADIDYWYNLKPNETKITNHHLVIIPDNILYTTPWISSGDLSKAFLNSDIYMTGLSSAKTTITNLFGSGYLLEYNEMLASSYSNGVPNNGAWTTVTILPPSQKMIFGSNILFCYGTTASTNYDVTISKTQLSLFKLNPTLIPDQKGQGYGTRDMGINNSKGCTYMVSAEGAVSFNALTVSNGIRPVFGIHG